MAQITATGTYGPYQWRGGGGTLVTSGTFDSATVQLQYSLDDGLTFTSYPGIVRRGRTLRLKLTFILNLI